MVGMVGYWEDSDGFKRSFFWGTFRVDAAKKRNALFAMTMAEGKNRETESHSSQPFLQITAHFCLYLKCFDDDGALNFLISDEGKGTVDIHWLKFIHHLHVSHAKRCGAD